MIRYDIKIYSVGGSYKTTINPNVLINDVSFSENVNGGQGQMVLDLALPFSYSSFGGGDFIKVVMYNERNKQGKQIYFGYISQITRIYDTNKGYIRITCLGVASLLNKVLFSGTYNNTAKNILTAIITQFNSTYGNILTIGQIDDYPGNINLAFQTGGTCQGAINKIQEVANYYWFVDADGVFTFREKLTQTNHIIPNEQEIETMRLNYSTEEIVNKLYVERQDGTVKTYQDATSQATYGIKEKYEMQTSILNETTQDEYGNNYISQNKDPKNASSVVVNNEYNIEGIVPGDTITIVNTEYEASNLLVEKINFTPERATLTLEELETLRDVINN